ncbi:MAG: 1-(5-phosphoribosyl)-5-[(5-phosphoribosylamino)methylideneamino]imidazole-4-carboxamide isomerase [Planctomycetes bacterium]|jgi:phosphoribosylformimino-5-aminoimidazole carboxamide ribotide isomerase|nr:1-(5-phosphoribosyl)-5-[(5-phosphoribosylamino)methylideneamino]imidazole-4-carboxamide isomerase [Phycisphaerae bacterium]NBB95421.1 1-(5-phosphoribosyl)-5-[(5-phosphoribosylamino)methylideneamino]imidazole-4-carboxamide isomerase [Planctomycetota bacterium]
MDLLPAIDIRGGQVVRLQRGDYDQQTTYGDSPLEQAKRFFDAGARWIHVVDLDAARSGELTNTRHLRAICETASAAGAAVQCGGGVRDTKRVEMILAFGVRRLVIGSAAMKDRAWFDSLLTDERIDNSRIALGLDARDGRLAAEGWTEQLDLMAIDLARQVSGSGLGAIVYTDIARDGMLTGVNVEATAELVQATDVPIIASGGVASIDDIRWCRQAGCGGAVLGKALYEQTLDLAAALAVAAGERD